MSDRKVAIVPIRKPLSELTAANKVYKNGQLITAVDELGRQGLKVGDWRWLVDDISAGTPFNDLPWLVAPAAAGSSGFTPFKVRSTSTANPKYEQVGDDAVITDLRLIGVDEPVVYTTALNVEFRDADMELDAVAGTLTIFNFTLPADEHISITVPAIITTADTVAAILPRLEALEIYTKPYAVGGAIYIWYKSADLIPEEFQEVTDFAGKTIFGYLPTDADFNEIGKPGGAKKHTLTVDELPLIQPVIKDPYNKKGGGSTGAVGAATYGDKITGTAANNEIIEPFGGGQSHSILNPYRVVAFIELKPEYQIL